jgi:hypothetical protein
VFLLLNIILEHIDAFILAWFELKISIKVQIGILNLQLSTNSHFHFLVILESLASQVLVHLPKIISSVYAAFTSAVDVLCHLVQLSLQLPV